MKPMHLLGACVPYPMAMALVGSFLLMASTGGTQAVSPGSWHQRFAPLPQDTTLRDVTHGSGRFVAVGEPGVITTSPDGITWTLQASGTYASLSEVAHGQGIYVAVGDNIAVRSVDGVEWTTTFTHPSLSLAAATYGNGRFVAAGVDVDDDASIVLTSLDGVHWTEHRPGRFNPSVGVAFGNGLFVLVSDDGSMLVSSDGMTWACRYSQAEPSSYSSSPSLVTFINGVFAVVDHDGLVAVSIDGRDWMRGIAPQLPFTPTDGAYADSIYVAVGGSLEIQRSNNGLFWYSDTGLPEFPEFPGDLTDITHGADTFVAVGSGGLILQSAPLTAEAPASPFIVDPPSSIGGILGEPAGFTVGVVGPGPFRYQWQRNGAPVAGATNNIFFLPQAQFSDQGAYRLAVSNAVGGVLSPVAILTVNQLSPLNFWHERDLGFRSQGMSELNTVAYGAGRFVALGDDNLLITSIDGAIWERHLTAEPFSGDAIVFGNGIFVALDYGYSYYNDCTRVFTSPDGLHWSEAESESGACMGAPLALAYGDGKFVAVGDRDIFYSINGVDWIPAVSDQELGLRAVTHGNGRFVAVGSSMLSRTVILSSVDGILWTFASFDPPELADLESPQDVAFGNGVFIVTGFDSLVLRSGNGTRWGADGLPVSLLPDFDKVAFGAGLFVASRDQFYFSTDEVWASADGIFWTPFSLGTGGGFFAPATRQIIFGRDTFVLLQEGSTILQSDPFLNTPPKILRQPLDRTPRIGFPITLRVEATGSSSLTYEWLRDGVPICLSEEPSLTLGSVKLSDAGRYQVVVRNMFGTATTDVFRLQVQPDEPILSLRFNGIAELTILGIVGEWYVIECRDQFNDPEGPWTPVGWIQLFTPEMTWTDLESPYYPRRFYRVSRPSPGE